MPDNFIPVGIVKSLYFKTVAVGVEYKCLGDLIGGIMLRGHFDGDPGRIKAFDLGFNLRGDEGE